ncbi:MAG: cytochrome P450, partial [Aggregatilineales bacterium]
WLLLVAGHETTVNLIANGTLLLMQHPDQMQKLQDDPALIDSAIEEILRFNGPVKTPTQRYAFDDIEVGGVMIPQGDVVLPSLLAANRDPQKFENPNVFDITRQTNPHIAFGHGIHFCLGAPLARMEGRTAMRMLLSRFPDINLAVNADELHWNDNILIHGMSALPVRLT